jgi:hypothetical protein
MLRGMAHLYRMKHAMDALLPRCQGNLRGSCVPEMFWLSAVPDAEGYALPGYRVKD